MTAYYFILRVYHYLFDLSNIVEFGDFFLFLIPIIHKKCDKHHCPYIFVLLSITPLRKIPRDRITMSKNTYVCVLSHILNITRIMLSFFAHTVGKKK